MTRPTVVHLTTVDMSLALLLLPQLIGFRDAGYDVVGVSAPGPYVSGLEAEGIRHFPLQHSTRAPDLRADLRTAREFVALCRRLRPDIVHTHNPKPGVYGRIGARLGGAPGIVNTIHGLYAQPTDGLVRRTVVYSLERLAATFSDAELVQNPEDLHVLRRMGVPRRKLHFLGNGIDLSRFDPSRYPNARADLRRGLGIADDEVIIGVVGRLVREKGYTEVFAAARRLRTLYPKARILVVGPQDPDKKDAITEAELNRASSDGRVMFLGMRDDVERLYLAMDLYVLASYREGFPRSGMEAAAMSLPIVATNIRGCRQVVDHGRTGWLVSVGDTEALVVAIGRLVSNTAERRTMGQAARAKAVAEFDHRRQVDITLAVYGQISRRRSRPKA